MISSILYFSQVDILQDTELILKVLIRYRQRRFSRAISFSSVYLAFLHLSWLANTKANSVPVAQLASKVYYSQSTMSQLLPLMRQMKCPSTLDLDSFCEVFRITTEVCNLEQLKTILLLLFKIHNLRLCLECPSLLLSLSIIYNPDRAPFTDLKCAIENKKVILFYRHHLLYIHFIVTQHEISALFNWQY